MKKRIVILASGSGTNAQRIIEHFQQNHKALMAEVVLVISNNKNAMVLERAKNLNVKAEHFSKEDFFETDKILKMLKASHPDLIVLAGFLLKIPENILKVFPDKIINIHPALLPKYGGKGMYGTRVHQAVIENNEPETGISIHYVNENYDEGAIIFQKTVKVSKEDTHETIAKKVHKLEHEWFPKIIEEVLAHPLIPSPKGRGNNNL